jgi:transposase
LFRWFVDLPLDTAVFDAFTYSKNQQRVLHHQVASCSSPPSWNCPPPRLVSNEHFSVDGTLIEAWASMKSFRPRD